MPVYKDEASGTWYVRLYYKAFENDGKKISKQKTKRGFNTRKEAKQWEAQFMAAEEVTMNVLLKNFVGIYFNDKKMELKESSIDKKRDMINKYILPYLGERAYKEYPIRSLVDAGVRIGSASDYFGSYSPVYLIFAVIDLLCITGILYISKKMNA